MRRSRVFLPVKHCFAFYLKRDITQQSFPSSLSSIIRKELCDKSEKHCSTNYVQIVLEIFQLAKSSAAYSQSKQFLGLILNKGLAVLVSFTDGNTLKPEINSVSQHQHTHLHSSIPPGFSVQHVPLTLELRQMKQLSEARELLKFSLCSVKIHLDLQLQGSGIILAVQMFSMCSYMHTLSSISLELTDHGNSRAVELFLVGLNTDDNTHANHLETHSVEWKFPNSDKPFQFLICKLTKGQIIMKTTGLHPIKIYRKFW